MRWVSWLLLLAACAPVPPATRCSWSFNEQQCLYRARRQASNKPMRAESMPPDMLDARRPAAVAAPAPCDPDEAILDRLIAAVHAAPACHGVRLTRRGTTIDMTVEDADLQACYQDPPVHAALAEVDRCSPS